MRITRLVSLASLISLTGCAEYELSKSNGAYDEGAWDTGGSEAPDSNDDGGGSETEDDFLALKPAQTDIYVFVANPGRGTVTRIDVDSLAVRTAEVGNDPSVVITTPDYATAVVFNAGDDSVTILDADTLDTRTVRVRDNFNNMVMSPDGRWVALWHDENAEKEDDEPSSGVQSFNEVSFVDTLTYAHFPMVVGSNPREIQFTPDGSLAVVVSDDYLAKVDLTAEELHPEMIQVAEDLLDAPAAEEVVLTPDGTFAFVRQFGAEDLALVDLLSEVVDRLPVGLNPTDIDLTPDGRFAAVVSRGSAEVWVFDVADPYAEPRVLSIPDALPFGSIQFEPGGGKAVLYTTASLLNRYAIWDLADDAITNHKLVKPVQTLAITPDGGTMLVFHTRQDSAIEETDPRFEGEWALTLIALEDLRPNPLVLPGEPTGYANSDSGEHGYFIMDGQPYLEILDYDTLLYDEVVLKSDPVYVGVFPDLDLLDGDEPAVWASQEHDLGRISFYDVDDRGVETITGFELNSQIEE